MMRYVSHHPKQIGPDTNGRRVELRASVQRGGWFLGADFVTTMYVGAMREKTEAMMKASLWIGL